jgi:hypothetical protein
MLIVGGENNNGQLGWLWNLLRVAMIFRIWLYEQSGRKKSGYQKVWSYRRARL